MLICNKVSSVFGIVYKRDICIPLPYARKIVLRLFELLSGPLEVTFLVR